MSSLLLETDSPVLGAIAGERNEPARVVQSLAAIAELKSLSVAEVREAMAANTLRLYGELDLGSRLAGERADLTARSAR